MAQPSFKFPEVRYGFYDFIARFVPGVIFLTCLFIVIMGPGDFVGAISDKAASSHLLSAAMLPFWLPITYSAGLVLAQTWLVLGWTLERIVRSVGDVAPSFLPVTERLTDADVAYKKECITEFMSAQAQDALDEGDRRIRLDYVREHPEEIPHVFVMLEQLRNEPSGDAERFLKLRAEERMCQASVVGLGVCALLFLALKKPLAPHDILTITGMLIGLAMFFVRAFRQRKRYAIGVCFAWLCRFSETLLPRFPSQTRPSRASFQIHQQMRTSVMEYEDVVLSIPALDAGITKFPRKDLLASDPSSREGKFSLEEHLDSIGRIRSAEEPKDMLIFGLRNTLVNGRSIAIIGGNVYASVDERPEESRRPYYGIALRSGRLGIERGMPEEFRNSPDVEFFVSGIPVLWDDLQDEEIFDLLITETYDQSHIYELPRGGHPDATPETLEAWLLLSRSFLEHLYSDAKTASKALRRSALSSSVKLFRSRSYLHSVVGVNDRGHFINVICHGRLEDVGKMAAALGCTRAVCVENSGSIMPTYVKNAAPEKPVPLLRAPNFRDSGRAVLAVVLGERGYRFWAHDRDDQRRGYGD